MKQIATLLLLLCVFVIGCNKDETTPTVTTSDGSASAGLDGANYTISEVKIAVSKGSSPTETTNTITFTGEDNSVINLYFKGETTDTWSLTQSGDYRATYTDTIGNLYKSINGEIVVSKYNNDSSITWVDGSFKFDGEHFSNEPLVKITNGTFKDVSDK